MRKLYLNTAHKMQKDFAEYRRFVFQFANENGYYVEEYQAVNGYTHANKMLAMDEESDETLDLYYRFHNR